MGNLKYHSGMKFEEPAVSPQAEWNAATKKALQTLPPNTTIKRPHRNPVIELTDRISREEGLDPTLGSVSEVFCNKGRRVC